MFRYSLSHTPFSIAALFYIAISLNLCRISLLCLDFVVYAAAFNFYCADFSELYSVIKWKDIIMTILKQQYRIR